MGIREKLLNIQVELKAPKGQYNSFGKYKYRSCEDILEALKPLLDKNKCTLVITDEIVNIGDRFYIKAQSILQDIESEETVSNTAYAREELEKKGQDGSQITGTASSYARKYCLNGLFLIDDTKDADTDEYAKTVNGSANKINATDVKALQKRFDKLNIDEVALCKQYGIKELKEMTIEQMRELNNKLNKIEKG
jgi:hypothetical protein